MARLFSSWRSSSNHNNNNNNTSPSSSSAATTNVVERVRKTDTGDGPSCPASPLRHHQQSQQQQQQQQQSRDDSENNGVCRRTRLNSRDIPRRYSGHYGSSSDGLLPFELSRHNAAHEHIGSGGMLYGPVGLYVTMIVATQLLVALALLLVVPSADRGHVVSAYSWTCSNFIHAVLTLIYIHWLKGTLNDDAGELSAMTIWEQLEGTTDTRAVREALMVMPCLLTWIACHAADYDAAVVALNVVLWAVSLAPKMPFMNGVRLFGINATAGIDDETSTSTTGKSNTTTKTTTKTMNKSKQN